MIKIILSILISSISIGALASITYNISIPQPDFISSDWDNDGIPNKEDNDDDNDGILDENDESPFDHTGQNSTPDVIVGGFHINKTSYFENEELTLTWNVDNVRSLTLFDNFSLLVDVTDDVDSTFVVSPYGDVIYSLDSETSVSEVSAYQFSETDRNCEAWTPLPSTVTFGEYFDQNRDCVVDFSSNEPSTAQITINEVQPSEGTLLDPVVNYFSSSKISYYPGEQISISWDVDNIRSLNLYSDVSLETLVGEVTSVNSINVSPSGDQSYYLDNEVSVSNLEVFEYSTAPQTCTTWLPLTSTVFTGQNVNQSRTCSITHTSNEPSSVVDTTNENQVVTGTKAAPVINSFTANKTSFFAGDSISLTWSVSNKGSLNLYDNAGLTSLVANVSSVNSKSVNPSGNKTYYLKTETGSASKSVYQYNYTNETGCSTWLPLTSTVNAGTNFTQSSNCTHNYSSAQPSSATKPHTKYRTASGSKVVEECRYVSFNSLNSYFFAKSYSNAQYPYFVHWDEVDKRPTNYSLPGNSATSFDGLDGYIYTRGSFKENVYGIFGTYGVCRHPK